MSEVVIEELTKSFSKRDVMPALSDVNLHVKTGELLVLLGPSGCGKSTLLRCVAGLEKPDAGRIRIGNDQVTDMDSGTVKPPNKRNVGMVFQNYVLWPHMTVEANVSYPLRVAGVKGEERRRRAAEMLELVHCQHLARRYPSELSGGQQQRVALARAMVSRPSVLLLDEPLSNLDALLRVDLRAQLREIHRELGFTGVYVTHDQEEALNLGTRVAVMRDGQIEQLSVPSEVFRAPRTDYVANFLGVRNSIELHRVGRDWEFDGGSRSLALDGHQDIDNAVLYLRPEHIRLSEAGGKAQTDSDAIVLGVGIVRDAIYGGTETDYVVELGGLSLFVRSPDQGDASNLTPEQQCVISFRHDDGLIYHDGVLATPRLPTLAASE